MQNKAFYRQALHFIDAGTPCCLVQILKTDGSTPLKVGAKALVDQTGCIVGTIGGGAVEAEAQRQGQRACVDGQARVFDFTMHGTSRQDTDPTCGGAMRVLVDPTFARFRSTFAGVAQAIGQRQAGLLKTTIAHSPNCQVTYQWQLPKDAQDAFDPQLETPQLIAEADRETLIDPIVPPPQLIIAGAGHVGQALAQQAVLIGFDVTIVDDRSEFCRPELFPSGVVLKCEGMAQTLSHYPLGADSYVVILTRNHQFDAAVLEACIHKPATYIGMIGSRRKIAIMRQDFVSAGIVTAEEFDRIKAPIGLDIGAVTPAEIATSIAAQLIAVRREASRT